MAPFADMAAVDGSELMLASADGCWVTDADGARYLDASASLWCCNLGHRVPEVNAAIAAQLDTLDSYSTFGDYGNEPANRLAQRLAALAPVDDARVFLTSGGGDSIDTAAKLARAHWQLSGRPEKVHLIGRTTATTARTASAPASAASRSTRAAGVRCCRTRRASSTTRCSHSRRRSTASAPTASPPSSASR